MRRVGRSLTVLAQAGLDWIFPPTCLCCGGETTSAGLVCVSCFRALPANVLSCSHCALPVPSQAYLDTQGRCAKCGSLPNPWSRAHAAWLYEGTARRLILQLKYADRLDMVPFLSRAMMSGAAHILDGAEYLVPVPMHRYRFWRRRFNQSALLARCIARKRHGLVLLPDALIRHRRTPAMARLARLQRAQVLEEAFSVRAHLHHRIAGRHIVLVDDILTTGATAAICARRLREAGARQVDLLVAARTVRLAGEAEQYCES